MAISLKSKLKLDALDLTQPALRRGVSCSFLTKAPSQLYTNANDPNIGFSHYSCAAVYCARVWGYPREPYYSIWCCLAAFPARKSPKSRTKVIRHEEVSAKRQGAKVLPIRCRTGSKDNGNFDDFLSVFKPLLTSSFSVASTTYMCGSCFACVFSTSGGI